MNKNVCGFIQTTLIGSDIRASNFDIFLLEYMQEEKYKIETLFVAGIEGIKRILTKFYCNRVMLFIILLLTDVKATTRLKKSRDPESCHVYIFRVMGSEN